MKITPIAVFLIFLWVIICGFGGRGISTSGGGVSTAAEVVGVFGSGSCSGYLKSDGTCDTPASSAEAGAYDADTWNANANAPTKDAVRDKIEAMPAYTQPGSNLPLCRTGAGTVGGCTNLTDAVYVAASAVPWQKDMHIPAPANTDVVRFRAAKAITLSAIGCIVDPADSDESVVVDVQECDGNGDNSSTVLSSTITCANTNTTGTISDAAIAANVWVLIDLGTVTGTVSDVSIYLRGTEAQ